eukprot:7500881-Pyramimonas_sp.AAC.1
MHGHRRLLKGLTYRELAVAAGESAWYALLFNLVQHRCYVRCPVSRLATSHCVVFSAWGQAQAPKTPLGRSH